ncbi:phage terminase small subunit P27 family [Blastochloris tepida]|uniref:Terminase n=1 Tax=Blastochloris tepida TaxID=2233851 RepID=A0A348FXT4_9HYPH|nr:phage terminase small subunit P27 family [Blastochloris tepida]BBF92117.1 terminase [Blastochloris tepida]
MGARGPKPKPTTLRVLEGNPGRLPINHAEPQPTGEASCPDHLSDDAKTKWREIMESVPPGMITVADAGLLEAYCEAWATHKAASEEIAASRDLFGKTLLRNGKPSPLLKIRTEAAKTMATLATRLGLSPADRSGLKLGTPKAKGKWSDLIA